ncbi:uncharacterized protein ACA1_149070 [Acanthamoeba castellanii str. Neff]|uniref:Uncharacterized protein n=1 Tax=Acanthamoeba castellanii (strain ATCC 30010 / Neff) TaxID=1257118 RepID=L8HC25_ACACF|nr:uncharacterized protein ACA1_149070 [Acanthamoeba castellanii str. Neff]ELR22740.1 hypothetical protein ACA1_149070 [Acanthamoeba castellanii str. Neff]
MSAGLALWAYEGYRNMLDVYSVPLMNVSLFWPLDAKVSLARSSARANVAQLLREVNIGNDGSAPALEADRTASVHDAKQIKEVLHELVGPLQVEHVHTHLCHGPTQQPVATRDGAIATRDGASTSTR